MFVISYIRFRARHQIDLQMVVFLEMRKSLFPNDVQTLLGLATAYTIAELYEKAYIQYNDILQSLVHGVGLDNEIAKRIEINIQFCCKPLPWSKGVKDHHVFRYMHYIFLKRFGNGRYNFITEELALEFNSYMRNKEGN